MVDFVRYPPDSTGKKSRHVAVTEIWIDSENFKPVEGNLITGVTSGATGVFVGAFRKTVVTYFISEVTGEFLVGENITINNAVVARVQASAGQVYSQSVVMVDPDIPAHAMHIDQRGAANVRFSEGEPQFDSFGRIQISQMQSVGEYYHVGEDYPGKFWTETVGSGSVTYMPAKSSMIYSCGTDSGALAARTTNQYHPYKPGTSQLCMISLAVGDNGKANVRRQWGYYDLRNGFGFRLEGTTLQVFLRSDVSGTTVETVVNQADFNGAALNDPSFSEYILDVSKMNIYWMDMQWMGAGRVRMGVISPDGRRITMHEFSNGNSVMDVYMRAGNLPIRWVQQNMGPTASTSEMKVSCGVVFTESADVQYSGVLIHTAPPAPIVFTSSTEYVPFLSFRPKLTINGLPNRIIGIHEDFDFYAAGDALHIGIFVNPTTLTGPVWSGTIIPSTMLEVDRSATSMSQDGAMIESFIAAPGSQHRIRLGDRIEKSFGLPADGVTQPVFVFAAKVIKAGGTPGNSTFFYTKYWKEIR